MKKILSNKVLWVFGIFFLLVFLQHQFLWLYHDDYGYVSLSYLFNYDGVMGTNTSFKEIVNFLIFHYNNWGGRVLYFLIEILSLRIGLPFFRLLQSIIITLIFYLIYKIVSKHTKVSDYKVAIVSCLCYGIFEIMTIRSGIFWATASVLYVYPLLPFLIVVYLYDDNISNIKYILCLFFIFIAAWSQEQISAMVVAFIVLYTIHKAIIDKKINWKNILMCLSSIAGFAVLMIAPGSRVRLTTTDDFSKLSLLGKIKVNLPNIINNVFGMYTKIFTILFLLVCLYLVYKNIKKDKKYILIHKIVFISTLCILLFTCIRNEGYFSYFYSLIDKDIYKLLSMSFMIIQLLGLLWSVLRYFYSHKEYLFIYLIISGLCSLGVISVAPYFPLRSTIMFDITMFIIAVYVFVDILKSKMDYKYVMFSLLVVSIVNFSLVTYGYYKNNNVMKSNDALLKETSKKIKQGEDITVVKNLKKIPDNLYAIEMPYDEGYSYIQTYMKYYYDLPQDIEFEYK